MVQKEKLDKEREKLEKKERERIEKEKEKAEKEQKKKDEKEKKEGISKLASASKEFTPRSADEPKPMTCLWIDKVRAACDR